MSVIDLHAAASDRSRRAESSANNSGVTPRSRAKGSGVIADHHSEGIRSLCHHLRTASYPAPVSSPSRRMPVRAPHSAMTDRNEVADSAAVGEASMPTLMGREVPKVKAALSRDSGQNVGQVVHMDRAGEELAEKRWRADFKRRLKEARGPRTQEDMAELLNISRDAYSKYEGGRETDFPLRLIPKFCKICGVSMVWLIRGEENSVSERRLRRSS